MQDKSTHGPAGLPRHHGHGCGASAPRFCFALQPPRHFHTRLLQRHPGSGAIWSPPRTQPRSQIPGEGLPSLPPAFLCESHHPLPNVLFTSLRSSAWLPASKAPLSTGPQIPSATHNEATQAGKQAELNSCGSSSTHSHNGPSFSLAELHRSD